MISNAIFEVGDKVKVAAGTKDPDFERTFRVGAEK